MRDQIVSSSALANVLDLLLWPLLRLWQMITRKRSCAWHWQSYRGIIGPTIRVAGDSNLSLHSWWHGVICGTNFTWQQVVVLRAVDPVVYHVGFRGRGVCQICTIPVHGAVAMLRGPEDTEFFGITADGQPLALLDLGHHRRWRLPRSMIVL